MVKRYVQIVIIFFYFFPEYRGSTFALDIVAMSTVRPSDNTTHSTIVITISKDNFSNPNCYPKQHMCFSTTEMQVQLPETTPYGTTLESLRPIPYQKLCPEADIKYFADPEGKYKYLFSN